MAGFSATDAAFEGFRLTREKPKALLVWAAFYLVISLIASALMITIGGAALMELESAGSAGADPAQALASIERLAPVYLILLPVGLITQAMLAAAVYRAILRPSEVGFGYLKVGGDEARLIGLTLIYILLATFAFAGVILVAGLAGAAVAMVAGKGAVTGLVSLGLGLFVMGLIVFVAVRLSLAPVITFDRRKLSLFDSWSLTHGQFWRLLGAYVLATISAFVVLLLAMVVFAAVAAVAAGGDLASVGALFTPDLSSLSAYFTPTMVVYTVFGALLNAFYYAVLLAPAAVAYRALTPGGQATAA